MKHLGHLSDDDLVSYLSNEVGPWRRSQTRRHIESCWLCRCRLNETEDLLHRLAEQVQLWPAENVDRVRDAKARFRRRVLAEEPLKEERPATRFIAWLPAAGWVAAAAAILLLLTASNHEDPLRRARKAEAVGAAQNALRQEFELAVGSEAADPSRTRIEVVSDRESGRFAVTWQNPDRSLIYGLWRPSASRTIAYRTAEHTGVRPIRSHRSAVSGKARFPEGARIEEAITDWLEFRELEPIQLARDGFLVSKLGDLGQPAQVAKADGRFIMRWDGAKPYDSVRLFLQVEAKTFLPISQTLQANTSTVRVNLKLLSQTPLVSSSLDSQTFEPSEMLVMAQLLPPGFRRDAPDVGFFWRQR